MTESKELRVNEITARMDEITTELCTLTEQLEGVHDSMVDFDKSEYFDEDKYMEVLKDIYGDVEICGMTMSQARILKEMDSTAFRCGMNDYIDSLDNEDFDEYNLLTEEEEDIENKISDLESEQNDLEEELSELLESEEN